MMLGNAFAAASRAKKAVKDEKTAARRKKSVSSRGASTKSSSKLSIPTIYENEADAKKTGRSHSPKPNKQRRKMWGGSAGGSGKESHDSSSKGSKGSKGSGTSNTSPGTPMGQDEFRPMHATISSDAKSLFSVYVGNDDNVSILTDDFHDLDMNQRNQQRKQMAQNGSMISSTQSPHTNALFTFRRRVVVDEGETANRETTLQAKVVQPKLKKDDSSSSSSSSSGSTSSGENDTKNKKFKEEIMSDLVKRLQEMAKTKASGVLRFPKEERIAIKDGEKRIVFVLPQLNNAKFSKEEFGQMKASDVLGLVPDRPVLVDIETEDTGEGETLELF